MLLGRLRPFGVRATAVRRSAWGQAPDQASEALLDGKGAWGDLPRFAAEADIIVVACSQDASSQGFVNRAFLAACKPGVVIVNVARGAHSALTLRCAIMYTNPDATVQLIGSAV